ncbi:MAG: radical SAM protein [Microgenomates group bacterium]|nr:radical SAM protein [Microgenomates group bacterium]
MTLENSTYTGCTYLALEELGDQPLRVLLLHLDSEKHFKARSEPIGVEQLACANNEKAQISLGRINQPEQINDFFDGSYLPDIIGLSLPLGSLELAESVINYIIDQVNQKKLKKPLIVLGGYIPTWYSDDHLSNLLKKYNDKVKIVAVRSGGERPLGEIIEREKKNEGFDNIPGVAYIDPETQKLRQTPPNQEFNSILNFSLTDHYLWLPGDMTGIAGAQGCPHNHCTFCTRPPQDKGKNHCWQARGPEQYVEDLKRLYWHIRRNHQVPIKIFFPDEEYISEENIEEIEERIKRWQQVIEEEAKKSIEERQLDIMEFEISVRADTIVKLIHLEKKDILEALKKLGLRRVFIGFESAIPDNFQRWDGLDIPGQLKRYGKGCSPEEQLDGIRILEGLGFDIELGTIFFDPLVDLGELYENFLFLKNKGLIPYAATPFSELRIQEGSNMEKLITTFLKKSGYKPEDFFDGDYDPSTMTKPCRYLHPLVEKIIGVIRSLNENNYQAKRVVKQAARGGAYDQPNGKENLGWETLSRLAEFEIDFILNLILLIKETLEKKGIPLSQYDSLTEEFDNLLREKNLLEKHKEAIREVWESHLQQDQSPAAEELRRILSVINE